MASASVPSRRAATLATDPSERRGGAAQAGLAAVLVDHPAERDTDREVDAGDRAGLERQDLGRRRGLRGRLRGRGGLLGRRRSGESQGEQRGDRRSQLHSRALAVSCRLRANGYGTRAGLQTARAEGAAGIQAGTAFALCDESGMRADYRAALLARVREAGARVKTDPFASPTGFPFKVAHLPGTVALDDVYAARPRICDLGYLREAYRTADDTIGYRCAAEPGSLFVSKGGAAADTVDRKCICNALMATAGYPQIRAGRIVEPGIVTSGDALVDIAQFLPSGAEGYRAVDVVRTLLGR